MTRQRTNSYSSSTLSSTSSGASSTGTYASIRSLSSYASRLSLQIKSTDFWGQFDRNSRKRNSVSSVFKKMFSKRSRGEPEKNISYHSAPLEHTTYHFPVIPVSRLSAETSFTERREAPPSSLKRLAAAPSPFPVPLNSCPAPAGLYCVIEDFLTEYDLRILEEEERAEMIARRSKEISWERENIRTVRV